MKLGLLIVGWVTLLVTTAALANISSNYTSLKEEDCQALSMVENLYQANCPSKQNYLLHTFSRDLRSGVDLIYNNNKVSYQPIPPFHVGETVEWRYEKVGNAQKYHALIYRIYTAQIDPLDGDSFYLPRE